MSATVSHTFTLPDGTPDRGAVSFATWTPATDDTPEVHTVTPGPTVVWLDDQGTFVVSLTASDDPGWRLEPEVMAAGGMPYVITISTPSWREVFTAYIPEGSSDLMDLIALDAPPEVSGYVAPVGIPAGGSVGQSLVKMSGDNYDVAWSMVSGGGGGVTDHGALTGLADADHPINAVQGLQAALNLKAPLASPVLTGVPMAPTVPANTAGDSIATTTYVNRQATLELGAHVLAADPHTQYAAEGHVHPPTSGTRRYLIQNPATGNPAAGYISLISTGGQNRTIQVSKTDADGVAYSLIVMLPGDDITVTDDPSSPPITAFARYVVTGPVVEFGTYWEFPALRTDTSGTTVAPADGTSVRFIPTMSGGQAPSDLAWPAYSANKAQDVNGIGSLWTPVLTLGPEDLASGVYEGGFSISWLPGNVGDILVLRERTNNGTWSVYAQTGDSTDYWRSFFMQYPRTWAGGPLEIDLEAKVDGLGVADIKYADLFLRQVQ